MHKEKFVFIEKFQIFTIKYFLDAALSVIICLECEDTISLLGSWTRKISPGEVLLSLQSQKKLKYTVTLVFL